MKRLKKNYGVKTSNINITFIAHAQNRAKHKLVSAKPGCVFLPFFLYMTTAETCWLKHFTCNFIVLSY